MKSSVFEGGVRTPSFIFSPLIKKTSRVTEDYIHITDWFPTLYNIAGGNSKEMKNLDGINQWSSISEGKKSERKSLLLNIDEIFQVEGAIVGNYKLVRGIEIKNVKLLIQYFYYFIVFKVINTSMDFMEKVHLSILQRYTTFLK